MDAAAVEIESVSHDYGAVRALDQLSLRIAPQTLFGLLGPNGGGKTTLFRLLSTLLTLQSGRVQMLGLDLARQAADVRRLIGVTFQHPSLDRQLTVRENLQSQGQLYGLRGAMLRERIAEVGAQLGLADRLADRCQSLSGGLQRRVEIAKGMLHRPRLLLLDEPSTGLDPGARHDLWALLTQLSREQQVTVLVTTHLMEEAERCDELAILHQGRLVAEGAPAALRASLGGEILTVEALPGSAVGELLQSRWNIAATVQSDSRDRTIWRAEIDRQVVPLGALLESLKELATGVSLTRPTLEDLFIQRTGHRFWAEREAGA